MTVSRYRDVPDRATAVTSETGDEFLALLEEAVKLRMISDVPLGAFLSGGVDSSVVTALMARQTDESRPFPSGSFRAKRTSSRGPASLPIYCGADHHEFVLGSEDFFSLMRKLVWHHDEPMIFPASIPLYLLSKESSALRP